MVSSDLREDLSPGSSGLHCVKGTTLATSSMGEKTGGTEAKTAWSLGKLTRAGGERPMVWGRSPEGCGKFHSSAGQCQGPQGRAKGLGGAEH